MVFTGDISLLNYRLFFRISAMVSFVISWSSVSHFLTPVKRSGIFSELAHRRLLLWFCRKGSVIVDVELTFDTKVGESEVSALLVKAIQDGKLGEFQVSKVLVGSFITGKLWLLFLSRKGKWGDGGGL